LTAFVPVQHSLGVTAAEAIGHDMPVAGVTVGTVTGSSAHGGGLLDVHGLPDRVLAWIAHHTS